VIWWEATVGSIYGLGELHHSTVRCINIPTVGGGCSTACDLLAVKKGNLIVCRPTLHEVLSSANRNRLLGGRTIEQLKADWGTSPHWPLGWRQLWDVAPRLLLRWARCRSPCTNFGRFLLPV